MIKRVAIASFIMLASVSGWSQSIKFTNEKTDTIRINNLLAKHSLQKESGNRIEEYAKEFIGTTYKGGTLEGKEEMLTINMDKLDCTTFVETVMALSITTGEKRHSWRDFAHNLRSLRYRGGIIDGYASRLHYISDWVVDNVHRGNIEEVTGRFEDAAYEIKTIDFMTANRELYPALSDNGVFNKIKEIESGYRSHRFPLIKSKSVSKATKGFLQSGDVIAFACAKKGLDVSHLGIVIYEDGTAKLLHASSREGRVVIDKLPLADYVAKNRNITGIRVFRLKE